jgi:Protein of unknown function (DUF2726)
MPALVELLKQHWALVAVLLGLAFVFWLARTTVSETEPPYQKRGPLVTGTELKFFKSLQAAVGGSWLIFCMVRLAEVLKVRADTPGAQVWRNKIFAKHLDFVLCHPDSLEVLLVIELDDHTHQRPERQARDAFVDGALKSAGIPIFHVPVADEYDKVALRKQLDEMFSGKKKK